MSSLDTFREKFPEFASVGDSVVEAKLQTVSTFWDAVRLGPIYEDVCLHAAAHLVAQLPSVTGLAPGLGGVVASVGEGPVSMSFAVNAPDDDDADAWLSGTVYGKIARSLLAKRRLGAVWVG